jgi:integrase
VRGEPPARPTSSGRGPGSASAGSHYAPLPNPQISEDDRHDIRTRAPGDGFADLVAVSPAALGADVIGVATGQARIRHGCDEHAIACNGAPSRIARVLKIDFREHDLRRTAATKTAEAGVPRHHISAVLNHVEDGARVTRVYDRYSYDAEKRKALETWPRRLHAIIDAGEPSTFAFG